MLGKHIAQFRETVNAIYGTYLDACDGFARVRARADEIDAEMLRAYEDIKVKRPELSHLDLGGTEVAYSRWVPAGSAPRCRHLHQVSTDVLRQRNADGGTNFQFIGNMCVVTLYSYWEGYYRQLLAQDLGIEKNALQVSLFGDLRRYRRAIIHHRAIATSKVEGCEVLRWFKRTEPILFRRDMFEEIIDGVFAFLEALQKTPEQFIQPLP